MWVVKCGLDNMGKKTQKKQQQQKNIFKVESFEDFLRPESFHA